MCIHAHLNIPSFLARMLFLDRFLVSTALKNARTMTLEECSGKERGRTDRFRCSFTISRCCVDFFSLILSIRWRVFTNFSLFVELVFVLLLFSYMCGLCFFFLIRVHYSWCRLVALLLAGQLGRLLFINPRRREHNYVLYTTFYEFISVQPSECRFRAGKCYLRLSSTIILSVNNNFTL